LRTPSGVVACTASGRVSAEKETAWRRSGVVSVAGGRRIGAGLCAPCAAGSIAPGPACANSARDGPGLSSSKWPATR
jgi:hypothetical protein